MSTNLVRFSQNSSSTKLAVAVVKLGSRSCPFTALCLQAPVIRAALKGAFLLQAVLRYQKKATYSIGCIYYFWLTGTRSTMAGFLLG